MKEIIPLINSENISLYELNSNFSSNDYKIYISSTPESRIITNDSLCVGCEYTDLLEKSCVSTLRAIHSLLPSGIQSSFKESKTTILHLLRGGLNFGLRGACNKAFSWNNHSSSFLSAQRERKEDSPEDWYITETAYQKVYLNEKTIVLCGDVVATGTSLRYALEETIRIAQDTNTQIGGFVFFTIGGVQSENILHEIHLKAKELFPAYEGSVVIYLEGRFAVPDISTPLRIKLTGTDLIRRDSVLAPEFIKSQSEDPAYPIERCTIYDAGSRAFYFTEYLEDVLHYWQEVHSLAESGLSYKEYVEERFPEIMGTLNLEEFTLSEISNRQIRKINELVSS